MKDYSHAVNVSVLSAKIGKQMDMDNGDCAILMVGGIFHDVGKMNIPSDILDKPSSLTSAERMIVEQHTIEGYKILAAMPDHIHKAIAEIALNHHERMDGSGYMGKYGSHIPVMARIVAVADVYDALISDRPYRAGWDKEKAVLYMQDHSGTLFDEDIVSALCCMINETERWPGHPYSQDKTE